MPIFSLETSGRLAYPSDPLLDDPDHELFIKYDTDFRGMRSRAREKEPWTFDWLRGFDENTLFYDIGACVGSYTLMAAARGATVVAFEPLRENIRGLVRNIDLNFSDSVKTNLTIVEAAVSSEPLSMFTHATNVPAGYGLGSLVPSAKQTEEVKVKTITLDAAAELYGYPTHIKIDVEGAEVLVFEDLHNVLMKVQSVIVEITNDENETVLNKLMREHGLTGREVGNRRTAEQRTKRYER